MSKLHNVVNNKVIKKTTYDKWVAEVNNIDINRFVLKTKCGTDKSDLEKKTMTLIKKYLPLVGLLIKTDYNAKITEIDGKISSITGLATTAALNVVENKMPDIRNLVKKADYNAKLADIEN